MKTCKGSNYVSIRKELIDDMKEELSLRNVAGAELGIFGMMMPGAEDFNIDVISFMADRTADKFTDMVDGMRYDRIQCLISIMADSNDKEFVGILKGLFYARGMDIEANDLDILEIIPHCENPYEYFKVLFMASDMIQVLMDDEDD